MTACSHLSGIRLLAREQRGCCVWRNGTHWSEHSTGSYQASDTGSHQASDTGWRWAHSQSELLLTPDAPVQTQAPSASAQHCGLRLQGSFSGRENCASSLAGHRRQRAGERGAFTREGRLVGSLALGSVGKQFTLRRVVKESEKTVPVKEILFSTKQHRIRVRVTMVTVPRKLPQAYSLQTFTKGLLWASSMLRCWRKRSHGCWGPRSLERRVTLDSAV